MSRNGKIVEEHVDLYGNSSSVGHSCPHLQVGTGTLGTFGTSPPTSQGPAIPPHSQEAFSMG